MNLNRLVADDLQLMRYIRAQQRSLRLVGIIPTWKNFMDSDFYFEEFQRDGGITITERRKYQAFWEMLLQLPRDKNDHQSISLAFAYLFQEKQRRDGGRIPEVDPRKFKFVGKDKEHVEKVREFVLSNYENLVPPSGGALSEESRIIKPA